MTTMLEQTRLIGGRYVLEKLIGEGGTGEVWRARHTALRSPVAIKFLHGSAAFRESTRRRFLTEARVAAQLNTRHAVKVFDFGVSDQGRPYLIMELLSGESLADRLAREGRLSQVETVRILRLAARALDCAHAVNVVHRDFKPENIFLVHGDDGDEDVKVVDFGVAKLVGDLGDSDEENEDVVPASLRSPERALMSFTRTGRSVGTPVYMAPEQTLGGRKLSPAVDIWALGVVAYECLTGRRPFRGARLTELFDRILQCDYPLAHRINDSLPAEFDAWFRKSCATDPAQRFTNASEAVASLVEALGLQATALPILDSDSGKIFSPSVRAPARPHVATDAGITSSERPDATSRFGVDHIGVRGLSARRALLAAAVTGIVAMGVVSWWSLRAGPAAHGVAVSDKEQVAATAPFAASMRSQAPPVSSAGTALATPSSAASASASAMKFLPHAQRAPPRSRPLAIAPKGDKAEPPAGGLNVSRPQPPAPATAPSAPPAATTAKPPSRKPAPASAFELPELGL
jgi:serine/threonine-protein kinase